MKTRLLFNFKAPSPEIAIEILKGAISDFMEIHPNALSAEESDSPVWSTADKSLMIVLVAVTASEAEGMSYNDELSRLIIKHQRANGIDDANFGRISIKPQTSPPKRWWFHRFRKRDLGHELVLAIGCDSLKLARQLLNDGAIIERNERHPEDWQYIFDAAATGNADGVAMLLEGGVNVNWRCGPRGGTFAYEGDTLLQTAIGKRRVEIVKILLKSFANVYAPADVFGALTLPDQGIRELISSGEKLSPITYVNYMRRRKDGREIDLIGELIGEAGVETPDQLGEELVFAAETGDSDRANSILRRGANVNFVGKGRLSESALMGAAMNGYGELVQTLLENGADVFSWGLSGRTALIEAFKAGHDDIVQMLMGYGARFPTKEEEALQAYHHPSEPKHYAEAIKTRAEREQEERFWRRH